MSSHAHDHAVALEDLPGAAPDPTPGPTFAVGLIGILVTIVVSLFVTVLYHWSARQEAEHKVLLRGHPELEALRARQLKQLETQRQDGKLVSISIERAMSLVQAERQAGR
jgi:hypothetical protein